jgi:aerobic C4-dicarboxylate transport protein
MAKPLYKNLTVQVLTAILIGVAIGYFKPKWGESLKPLGDAFINLVKMVVGPIIFLTIVVGIAKMGDLKKVGRVGWKALLYFEVITTLSMMIGMVVANVFKPGAGIVMTAVATTQPAAQQGQAPNTVQFLLGIIPDNVVNAFAKGDLLQILLFAILFGMAVASLGTRAAGLLRGLEQVTAAMFGVVALIMKVAPLGALGAMAYTIGKFGLQSLLPLMKLMACVYLTMALFIFVVLGTTCRVFGFSLLRYLAFIKEEILLALGPSSSESVLPRMIEKMELIGCSRSVVALVIPAGYSFNLDGTSIYLSMGALFIAQAVNVHLNLGQQLYLLGILMVTSKGAAAVTGGGFITLQATLAATRVLPVEGVFLLQGVDRFMSEARTITNLIGNGVATICVSKMEGEFDRRKYEMAVSGRALQESPLPVEVAADLAAQR